MGRVGGVAHEHDSAHHPGLVGDARKADPWRAAQVAHVCKQPMPVKPGREQKLAEGDGAGDIKLVEPRRAPVPFRGLDDEGGCVAVEAVGVRLKPPPVGLHEDEGECLEGAMRAEPDELVLSHVDKRPEMRRVAGADPAVDAVGAHDQVGVGKLRHILHLALEDQLNAKRLGTALENVEEVLAFDAGEAMSARGDDAALVVDVDVVPMGEAVEDFLLRGRVGAFQVAQRLVGEHDAPAERVMRAVALDHGNTVRPVAPLHLDREIQARRPAARADDPHG
jgi:hypothetical protein